MGTFDQHRTVVGLPKKKTGKGKRMRTFTDENELL
jgi:hypothetical protein